MRRPLIVSMCLMMAGPAFGGLGLNDIRAWYRLDGTVADASGHGRDGVLPGAGMNPTFADDVERDREVALFDGIDDYIDVSATLEMFGETSPGGQLAISMWLKTGGPGGDPLAQNVVMGAEPDGGVIEIVGNGSWGGMGGPDGAAFGINSGGGGGSTGTPSGALAGALQDGGWHHLFIQWVDPDGTPAGNDSAEAEIWIDGTLAADANGATSFNGNMNGDGVATLGKGTGSNGTVQAGSHYTGAMADVIFFNRQLTPTEVVQAMTLDPEVLFTDGFESGTDPWDGTFGDAAPALSTSCAEVPFGGSATTATVFPAFDLTSADFDTVTGCGGLSAAYPDAVFCITPTSSCTVGISSTRITRSGDGDRGGSQWLYVFTGGCTTTPASCLTTASDASSPVIPSLALTAGETYCTVVKDSNFEPTIQVELSVVSGSCWN